MLTPRIQRRTQNPAVLAALSASGVADFESNILSGRISVAEKALELFAPKLKHLDNPFLMADMQKAVERLAKAIKLKQVIGIETDHDCDGQTSHAVIHETLIKVFGHPKSKIRSYIGHRMKEGYGLSGSLAKRILNDEPKADLIITADNGSTDEARIAQLKYQDIDTIVTDHHAIPKEGIPRSAFAVLNPTREDCQYPDSAIAGCMVAWLFMAATRGFMIQQGLLSKEVMNLSTMLDFVAVGTVADCVSMANSVNNRAVTIYGMKRISAQSRSCWRAFKQSFQKEIGSEFIGFTIGPMLNSDGRLSDAFSSVNFLLSESSQESNHWVNELTKQNEQRKLIQKNITDQAMREAVKLVEAGQSSIAVYLQSGHAGVHGISASRIKDAFGRPTIIFSPKEGEPDVMTGSARSVDGIHLKHILDKINEMDEAIFIKYGGHSGAAGMTIVKGKFESFCNLFESQIIARVEDEGEEKVILGPVIYTDGELHPDDINLATVKKIKSLEPFGRGFEYPVYNANATIVAKRMVGKEMQHAQLQLNFSGKIVKAIWFNAIAHKVAHDIGIEDEVCVIFKLTEEYFNRQHKLSAMIEYIEKI